MNQNPNFSNNYQLISNFNIPTILGSGANSSVQLALDCKNQKYVAVKKIYRKLAIKETFIHSALSHPNILCFIEPFYDFHTQSTFLVLQYVSNGTLHDLITENYSLSIPQIVNIFKGVCSGLLEIQKKFIIHRDIKVTSYFIQPSNILLGEHYEPKICDFGSATFEKPNLREVCGTFQYLAPEILAQKSYNNKVDIWAMGVTFYEVVEGKIPFKARDTMQRLKEMEKPLQYEKEKSQKFIEIIKKMLSFNAENRPSLEEIIQFLDKVEIQNTDVNFKVKKENTGRQEKGRFDSQNSTFDDINESKLGKGSEKYKRTRELKVEPKKFWESKKEDKTLRQSENNGEKKNFESQRPYLPKFKFAKTRELLKKARPSTNVAIKFLLENRKA